MTLVANFFSTATRRLRRSGSAFRLLVCLGALVISALCLRSLILLGQSALPLQFIQAGIVQITPQVSGPAYNYGYAAFAISNTCGAITLSGNGYTDSFDSSLGTYATTKAFASAESLAAYYESKPVGLLRQRSRMYSSSRFEEFGSGRRPIRKSEHYWRHDRSP